MVCTVTTSWNFTLPLLIMYQRIFPKPATRGRETVISQISHFYSIKKTFLPSDINFQRWGFFFFFSFSVDIPCVLNLLLIRQLPILICPKVPAVEKFFIIPSRENWKLEGTCILLVSTLLGKRDAHQTLVQLGQLLLI